MYNVADEDFTFESTIHCVDRMGKLIAYTLCIHVHCITQYGSTVYIGIAMGGPALQPYIRRFSFHFQFHSVNPFTS